MSFWEPFLVVEDFAFAFQLDSSLCVGIIRCFLRAEANARIYSDVRHVVAFTFDFQRPHRNSGVLNVGLVEVKYDHSVVKYLLHVYLLDDAVLFSCVNLDALRKRVISNCLAVCITNCCFITITYSFT